MDGESAVGVQRDRGDILRSSDGKREMRQSLFPWVLAQGTKREGPYGSRISQSVPTVACPLRQCPSIILVCPMWSWGAPRRHKPGTRANGHSVPHTCGAEATKGLSEYVALIKVSLAWQGRGHYCANFFLSFAVRFEVWGPTVFQFQQNLYWAQTKKTSTSPVGPPASPAHRPRRCQ